MYLSSSRDISTQPHINTCTVLCNTRQVDTQGLYHFANSQINKPSHLIEQVNNTEPCCSKRLSHIVRQFIVEDHHLLRDEGTYHTPASSVLSPSPQSRSGQFAARCADCSRESELNKAKLQAKEKREPFLFSTGRHSSSQGLKRNPLLCSGGVGKRDP